MDDRPRWPGGPQGQPGRPVPARGPGGQPRGGSGGPPPPGRTGRTGAPSNAGGPPQKAGGPPPKAGAPRPPAERRQRPEPRGAQAEPPPRGDVWGRERRAARGRAIGRTLVALLSVLVLSSTGYAWATLRGLNKGMNTNDVIGAGLSAPDGATDILLIGNDSRTDAQGNPLPEEILKELRTTDDEGGDLTDSMILVRVPNGGQRAGAVSFPRDTMVNLGDGEAKLNSAMGKAKSAERAKLEKQRVADPRMIERQSSAAGQKFLIQTIEKLSGVSIDHYAEVNLLGFYEITKAVGGVDVCLNDKVDDSDYSGAVLPKGPQTIQGADALAFVRQRHGLPNGDLDRVVRQQVFMSGLAQKMLAGGTLSDPTKLAAMTEAVKKAVVLDKGWDVISFAQQMQGVAGGAIEFNTIPVHLEGESGQEDVVVNEPEVHRFVANLLLDPAARQAKQQQDSAAEKQRSRTTVSVFNASGISGLASRVLDAVSAQGFNEGTSANAGNEANSVVYHAPGDEAVAGQAAQTLGGLPLQPKENLAPGNVEVYLGKDYAGPGAQNFAGPKAMQLDGLQQSRPQPSQAEADGPPITANGVRCVN